MHSHKTRFLHKNQYYILICATTFFCTTIENFYMKKIMFFVGFFSLNALSEGNVIETGKEACLSSYAEGVLSVPCIGVYSLGTPVATYSAMLSLANSESIRFTLQENTLKKVDIAMDSVCLATYNLESNSLSIPCAYIKGDTKLYSLSLALIDGGFNVLSMKNNGTLVYSVISPV